MKFPRRQFLLWERAASSAIVLDRYYCQVSPQVSPRPSAMWNPNPDLVFSVLCMRRGDRVAPPFDIANGFP
jgi:hypothetical protein